jgi:hypothetical protein
MQSEFGVWGLLRDWVLGVGFEGFSTLSYAVLEASLHGDPASAIHWLLAGDYNLAVVVLRGALCVWEGGLGPWVPKHAAAADAVRAAADESMVNIPDGMLTCWSQLHTLTAAADHSQAVVPLLYVISLAVLVLLPAGPLVLKP